MKSAIVMEKGTGSFANNDICGKNKVARRLATLKMYYLAAITSYSPFDGARARRNKLIATDVFSESDELSKYEIHAILNKLEQSV